MESTRASSQRPWLLVIVLGTSSLVLLAAALLTWASSPWAPIASWLPDLLAAGFPEDALAARLARFVQWGLIAGLGCWAAAGALWLDRGRWTGRLAASYGRFRLDAIRALRNLASDRGAMGWLAALTLVGVGIRLWFLDQPMRYDEAHTYLAFVFPRTMRLFFYGVPNNHVAHTLLVWASTALLGAAPWAIRLPAFLAGVLIVPGSFMCARLVLRSGGLLAAGLAAASSYLVLFSTNARGYSILALVTLALVVLTPYVVRTRSLFGGLLWALLAAVGLYTIPVMLFPMAMLLLWALALAYLDGGWPNLWRIGWWAAGLVAVCAVTTLALYAPVLVMTGGEAVFANQYVTSRPMGEVLAMLPNTILTTWGRFSRDVPAPVTAILGGSMGVGLVALWKRNRAAFWLYPAAVVGCLGLVLGRRVIPFDRTWIFLLPIGFGLIDAAWTALLSLPPGRGRPRLRLHLAGALGLLFALGIGYRLASTNSVIHYPETGAIEDAEAIAEYLQPRLEPGDYVLARNPANMPLRYYLLRRGVPLEVFQAGGDGQVYVVVQLPRDTFEKLARGAGLDLDPAEYETVAFPGALLYVPRYPSD